MFLLQFMIDQSELFFVFSTVNIAKPCCRECHSVIGECESGGCRVPIPVFEVAHVYQSFTYCHFEEYSDEKSFFTRSILNNFSPRLK